MIDYWRLDTVQRAAIGDAAARRLETFAPEQTVAALVSLLDRVTQSRVNRNTLRPLWRAATFANDVKGAR